MCWEKSETASLRGVGSLCLYEPQAFKLAFADGEPSEEQKNTAILFGVEKELEKQQLCIHTLRSTVTAINFADGSMTMAWSCCFHPVRELSKPLSCLRNFTKLAIRPSKKS
jgi:hypothetical protein